MSKNKYLLLVTAKITVIILQRGIFGKGFLSKKTKNLKIYQKYRIWKVKIELEEETVAPLYKMMKDSV